MWTDFLAGRFFFVQDAILTYAPESYRWMIGFWITLGTGRDYPDIYP